MTKIRDVTLSYIILTKSRNYFIMIIYTGYTHFYTCHDATSKVESRVNKNV